MFLTDSHCHLDFTDFGADLDSVIKNASENGVKRMVSIGTTKDDFANALALTQKYNNIYCSFGIHPHEATQYADIRAEEIVSYVKADRIIGIGECGLDYFYENSSKAIQAIVFKEHIKAGLLTDLPLMIHTRDADADTMAIIDEIDRNKKLKAVIHCFSSSADFAKFALERGFYLSFSGIITFGKAENVREVLKTVPLERILIETDSPFLAPTPFRGKRNEPAYVRYVAEKVAEIRGLSLENLAIILENNFKTLFKRVQN